MPGDGELLVGKIPFIYNELNSCRHYATAERALEMLDGTPHAPARRQKRAHSRVGSSERVFCRHSQSATQAGQVVVSMRSSLE